MYAFVCSQSAVDAIRSLSARGAWGGDPAWPESPRALPLWGDCVCSQRSFAEFTRENDPSVLEGLFPPVDLLVPSSRFRSSGKSAKFHVWSREIPAGACRRLSERLVISGPEFAIVQLAGSLGKFDSLFDGFMVELREQKELLASVGQEGEFAAELPQKWEQIRRLAALASLACEFAGTYRLAVGTPALSESGLAKKNCAPESSGAGVPGLSAAGAQRPGAGAPLSGVDSLCPGVPRTGAPHSGSGALRPVALTSGSGAPLSSAPRSGSPAPARGATVFGVGPVMSVSSLREFSARLQGPGRLARPKDSRARPSTARPPRWRLLWRSF